MGLFNWLGFGKKNECTDEACCSSLAHDSCCSAPPDGLTMARDRLQRFVGQYGICSVVSYHPSKEGCCQGQENALAVYVTDEAQLTDEVRQEVETAASPYKVKYKPLKALPSTGCCKGAGWSCDTTLVDETVIASGVCLAEGVIDSGASEPEPAPTGASSWSSGEPVGCCPAPASTDTCSSSPTTSDCGSSSYSSSSDYSSSSSSYDSGGSSYSSSDCGSSSCGSSDCGGGW
jgi:hypothetical protein